MAAAQSSAWTATASCSVASLHAAERCVVVGARRRSACSTSASEFLPNGRISVYSNNTARGRSDILQIDPQRGP